MISIHAVINPAFSVALTLATNGVISSGTSTNRDVVTSTTSSSLSVVNCDYEDSKRNYCPVITNSGSYTILNTGNIWGYQAYITVAGAVTAPCGFAVTSLANNEVTNLQSLINSGLTSQVYSTYDTINTNFVPNVNFWLASKFQITGMVASEQSGANPLSGQECGSAVSPLHVLVCWHAPYTVGQNLWWVATNGAVVERSVIAVTTNFVTGSDIEVCLLNAALPASVIPLPVLPSGYGPYLPASTNTALVPVICGNQSHLLTPKIVSASNVIGQEANVIANQFWFPRNWGVPVTGGDSGSPICLVIGTNLVLVSHWHSNNSGPWYPNYGAQINQAMHYLSTNNSVGTDYQLTTVDLSPYPTF